MAAYMLYDHVLDILFRIQRKREISCVKVHFLCIGKNLFHVLVKNYPLYNLYIVGTKKISSMP